MEDRVKKLYTPRGGGKSFAAMLKDQLRMYGARGGLQQLPKLPEHQEMLADMAQYSMIGLDAASVDATSAMWGAMTRCKAFYSDPTPRSLSTYSDAEMIMEMIGRGYAVMKTPQGGAPETLK